MSGGGNLEALARNARESGAGVDMSIFDRALVPVYPASAKFESWTFVTCIRQVLDQLDPPADPLPAVIRTERGLLG